MPSLVLAAAPPTVQDLPIYENGWGGGGRFKNEWGLGVVLERPYRMPSIFIDSLIFADVRIF